MPWRGYRSSSLLFLLPSPNPVPQRTKAHRNSRSRWFVASRLTSLRRASPCQKNPKRQCWSPRVLLASLTAIPRRMKCSPSQASLVLPTATSVRSVASTPSNQSRHSPGLRSLTALAEQPCNENVYENHTAHKRQLVPEQPALSSLSLLDHRIHHRVRLVTAAGRDAELRSA